MNLLLTCLLFGTFGSAFVVNAAPAASPYIRYVELIKAVETHPLYARVSGEETSLHQSYQSGDPAAIARGRGAYTSVQREFLKVFGTAFANLATDFGRASVDETRARAFVLDPHGVGSLGDGFTYAGPADGTFLDHAHVFVGAFAFTLLDLTLSEIKADAEYTKYVGASDTHAELPPRLVARYRPAFEALDYAFRHRGDGTIRRTVTLTPDAVRLFNFAIQDSLENLLNFDEARKALPQTVEMLSEFAREHASTCEVEIAG